MVEHLPICMIPWVQTGTTTTLTPPPPPPTHTQPHSPAVGQSQWEVHMSPGVTLALSGCPMASVSWEMSVIQVPMSSQNEKKMGWHRIQVACGGVCSQIIFIYDL